MADVEKYAERLKDLTAIMKEASKITQDVCGWPLDQVCDSYLSMYDRFCPFKVGDRVILNKAPPCEGGWSGSKHFLVAGALGTVRSRSYQDGLFTFTIMWDEESWKDDKGTIHPTRTEQRHVYGFSENWLWPAPSSVGL